MNERLISDWKDTVGLTVDKVEYYLNDTFDDPVEFTFIYFTNGKFIIQKDQSHYTTTCGLISEDDYIKTLIDLSKSKLIE